MVPVIKKAMIKDKEGPFTDLVRDWALCCKKVSLWARMLCKLFLSISLAAGGTLLIRNASGNQMMFAVRVTAGTCREDFKLSNGLCSPKYLRTILKRIFIYIYTHFFANIQKRFVQLFVYSPENVKMQNKKARDSSILIPLVNL